MSGAGVDPVDRVRVLLLRGDELLESGSPESLDEALLVYQGALDLAADPSVADDELRSILEERVDTARDRLARGGSGPE